MKRNLLLLICLLSIEIFAQNTGFSEIYTLDSSGYYHGVYQLKAGNNVLIQGYYNHGKKGGRWNYFNVSGQKTISGFYFDNFKNGKWSYYKDGLICSKISYKQGLLNGTSQAFYENGQLRTEFNYSEGILDGDVKYFNKDGVLIEERFYRSGFLDSTYSVYNKNEKLLIRVQFSDGIPVSIIENKTFEGYHFKIKGNLLDGNGKFRLIKLEKMIETPIVELNLVNGKLNGEYISYYIGRKRIKGKFENGFAVGTWIKYTKEGIVEKKMNYVLEDSITSKILNVNNIGISEYQFWKNEYFIADVMPKFLGEEISEKTNFGYNLDKTFFELEKTKFDSYLKPQIENLGITSKGNVFVKFKINLVGEVVDVEILRGLSEEEDIKILNVFKNLPNIEQGYHEGFPTRVSFTKPIGFN